jgi:hypothetical protein
MKTTTTIFLAAVLLLTAQACVDKSYDLGELDKDAVLNIPPVPVGTVDTAWFKSNLDTVKVEIPGFLGTFAMEYSIKNFFTEDIISKFFFDGADDVTLKGKLDIFITGINANALITMRVNIIDKEGEPILEIPFEDTQVANRASQDFILLIDKARVPYMATASGVKITFIFSNLGTIALTRDDFLVLNSLVLKTGGMLIEL